MMRMMKKGEMENDDDQGNDEPDEIDGDQQPQIPSETNDEYAEEDTVHEDMTI
jgi:hypothetical protein